MISGKDAVRPDKARVMGLMEFWKPRGIQKDPTPHVPSAGLMHLSYSPGTSRDYHAGDTRVVRTRESSLLEGQRVWNERAVSICIAQELYRVAELSGLASSVSDTKARIVLQSTGLTRYFGDGIKTDNPEGAKLRHIALMAAIVGCNILIDDPEEKVRDLMGNGNVISFLPPQPLAGEPANDASVIISSYNEPCGTPKRRAAQMLGDSAPEESLKDHLEVYRGWLAGIYSEGYVELGSGIEVNVAPTTPPLPER